MLNCVPVVVKGGGGRGGGNVGGCVGKSATGEIASEEQHSLADFFSFFSIHREGEKRISIWPMLYADERIRDFRRLSSIFLTSSLHGEKQRERKTDVTHRRQIFIPKWRRGGGNIFTIDRPIDRPTCCLSISRSRSRLGLV